MRVRLLCLLLLLLVVVTPISSRAQAPIASQSPAAGVLLSPAQMGELFPPSVFFAGKLATTQARNSGGVGVGDDRVTSFALVDASGYSSGIRERYQFYLLTSVAVNVAGKRLEPGAYGGGFLNGQVLLMDLSAKEVVHTPLATDAEMKRPRPLQVVVGGKTGEYRLYLGREYVSFRQIL